MLAKRIVLFTVATLVANAAAESDPIEQPECDSSKTVSIRYSSSSQRLYIEAGESGEQGGCVTLTEIFEAREGKEPLYAVDPETGDRVDEATGTWLLTESLYVEDGITLNVSQDPEKQRDGVSSLGEGCEKVCSCWIGERTSEAPPIESFPLSKSLRCHVVPPLDHVVYSASGSCFVLSGKSNLRKSRPRVPDIIPIAFGYMSRAFADPPY